MKLLILNGPNLNLQGRREKSVYGAESFEEFVPRLRALYSAHTIDYAQSNIEGELIDILHKAEGEYDAYSSMPEAILTRRSRCAMLWVRLQCLLSRFTSRMWQLARIFVILRFLVQPA